MKKPAAFLMIVVLLCTVCACGSKSGADNGNVVTGQNPGIQQDADREPTVTGPGFSVQDTDKSNNAEGGGMRSFLNSYGEAACNTESGFYYLTKKMVKLRDGSDGRHLMYMDFATEREIYLCSTASCKHDSLDCPAVFLKDDFPVSSSRLFVFGDKLYILARGYYYDNSATQTVITSSYDNSLVTESRPDVLYRANLDGTERKKVYTFDADITLEDMVIGNDQGIYLITKKLSIEKYEGQVFINSMDQKLVFLNLNSLSMEEICPMTFEGHISWDIIGCSQNEFILKGIDHGREVSQEEIWDDDAYYELYQNSFTVYARLSKDGGKPEEICRQSNFYYNSGKVFGDSLYLSSAENQKIEAVTIKTGEKRTLCTLPQNRIMDVLGDMLCCQDWNLTGDCTWYFVNTKTGAVTKTPLVNRYNGQSIEFRGQTASDVLFVYDYDVEKYNDNPYGIDQHEINQKKHALISKEDLFAGREDYRKIEMVGPGQ